MNRLPSGTVTFLFTDIEGSTRLLAELGDAYADALAEHRRVVRAALARHGGVEVDTQGDGFFVAFTDAGSALAAAEDAQAALALPVRIGVHAGKAEVTTEGYVGLEVHRAARICAVAHGGQVVVSAATRACVLEHKQLDLRDLGLHRLKDLAEPVRLYQLGGQEFPPLRSLNATNLPVQPNALIGRERELEEVTALLRDGARLVTLTGPGGTGKTRLALQAAAELVDDFPDGVFWVPLAAIRDRELVLPTIEQTLGAKAPLPEHVDEQRMLLLLDNLEQVIECAPALTDVLAVCPNLKLLVTSRVLLRVQSEREYQVFPLTDPDAVELFRERAANAEPAEAVAEICRRLDGLPLAIELAAARTRVLPPHQLLRRLERRLPLLSSGSRDAPVRQRTLRATIEWSHDLLHDEEQRLFARLSVFIGGFTFEAAEMICSADLDTLESLVESSLVRPDVDRFTMLETIREYAVERLEEAGEAEDLRARHAEYYVVLGERAEPELDGQERFRWLEQLAPERENARAAFLSSFNGAPVVALRLAAVARAFRIPPRERAGWSNATLSRDHAATPEILARAREAAGWSAIWADDYDQAGAHFEEARRLYRELGDELHRGNALLGLGHVKRAAGKLARARALHEQAIELLERVGDPPLLRGALGDLGELETELGNYERANELLEQSLSMARAAGATSQVASILHGLGDLALATGDAALASARYTESLTLLRDQGPGATTCCCLAGLAAATAGTNPDRATTFWATAQHLETELGFRISPSIRQRYEASLHAAGIPTDGISDNEVDYADAVALALHP
jgi:predicted ATPase/class 3 adenylate cyclase